MNSNITVPKPQSRIAELDLLRAFAIIAVIAIHSTSFATIEMTASSPVAYFLYNAANIGMNFAVPVFLFLSSLVLFKRYGNMPFTGQTFISFYRKRATQIIIPYTVCSAIYYIAVEVTRAGRDLQAYLLPDFLEKLATGTAYAHLYYIFIIIQFYALFPFVLRLLQAFPRLVSWGIPFGIAVQAAFYIAGQFVDIPNAASWFLSYFGYYMLGVFVGLKYGEIRSAILSLRRGLVLRFGIALLWGGWLASGLVYIVLWYKFRLNTITPPTWTFYFTGSIYSYLSALTLTYGAVILETRWTHTCIVRFLKKLSPYSFGIYLLHPLLLAAYRELRPLHAEPYLYHAWYVGGFLLALFGTWAIVAFAQRYIPWAWIVLGSNEVKQAR
jgi:peptidoglycan/LPS O-acetylase OafA/YrhL